MTTLITDEEINEVQAMRERLAQIAKDVLDRTGSIGSDQKPDTRSYDALQRANSWLGNVTNPLTPEEEKAWREGPLHETAVAECDDNDLGNWAHYIEASATDEDRRAELDYFRDLTEGEPHA